MPDRSTGEAEGAKKHALVLDAMSGKLAQEFLKPGFVPNPEELKEMLAVLEGVDAKRYNDGQRGKLQQAISAIEIALRLSAPENAGFAREARERMERERTDAKRPRLNPELTAKRTEAERLAKAGQLANRLVDEVNEYIATLEKAGIETIKHMGRDVSIKELKLSEHKISGVFKYFLRLPREEVLTYQGGLINEEKGSKGGIILGQITRAGDLRKKFGNALLEIIRIIKEG